MIRTTYILLVGFLSIILFSCKKESNDNQPPNLTINSPKANQSFNALEFITIEGVVSDNEKISSIIIALRDNNNINVGKTISLVPNTPIVTLSEQLILDDKYLKSGAYTLKISVSDGINQVDKYINVNINEVPKSRNGLFIFSNSGSTTQVVKLDNTLMPTSFKNISGDFLAGQVNSTNQQVISCGKNSGDLIALNIANSSPDWQIANLNAGFPFFTSFAQHYQDVFVGYYNRDIKRFNPNGIQSLSAQAFVNSYVNKFFVHENNLLITSQNEISGGTTRLVTYYLTGFVKDNVLLNEEVIAFFSYSTNEIALFTNSMGNGKLLVYNILSNSTWNSFTLLTGTITSATEFRKGVYLVTQNGKVNLIDLNTYTKSTYLATANAQIVKYDATTNEVLVVEGNTLTTYDYPTKTIKGTYTHTDSILAVDFWYNK
ncbi:MAG: hypothetical protein KF732_09475 [Flavobacteriales bacterium]|nr:hypothetical protein [Flavobacteriales bacterium]MBX2960173.1 hypothetical protein [Flavobacteriales bacterium]